MMFSVGDIVRTKYNNKIGAIVSIEQKDVATKFIVLIDGKKQSYYEEQIEPFIFDNDYNFLSAKDVNSLLTARLLLNPNINSLYSLNSSKIDYIPYQFRPVLKIIKSDSPRILIADGVGVGKTIEAGLILKELEARFDIKTVLVICPRPLITEKKWQNELRDKFGEKFVHIDGEKLHYCINETYLEEEWPEDYSKCIIPYSLLDEAVVFGTAENGAKKLNKKSFADLKPFPKFDLIIIDEAHHIRNPRTYAYQAVQMFCENAASIIMLTATPIQLYNNDLFVLLHLLRPDLIYDYKSFEHMSEPNPYINAAVKLIRSNDNDWQNKALSNLIAAGETNWGAAVLECNPVYKKAINVLKQSVISQSERVKLITDVEGLHTFARIINRTRRRDIGEFTVRKPETLMVEFTKDQTVLYNELLHIQESILIQLHGDQGTRFMMTTIMRQASSCIHGLRPFLKDILTRRFDKLGFNNGDMGQEVSEIYPELKTTPQIVDAVEKLIAFTEGMSDKDTKVEALIKVIKNKQLMPNNKVMLFSSFRHTLQYLYEKLLEQGIRVGIVHGGVKDEERVILRNRFKSDRQFNDSLDVLLFSEVGCEGLDYQFCDCLINYDLPWNPQTIEQRIGRIDRNGQKSESVSIINIITKGTIDFEIYDRCLLRIGVFNSSIGDSEEILGEVTQEIYNIVDQYILNPEERAKKELQITDNAIRKMQEQQRLEEEKHAFFGLDINEEARKKEMQDATNIHLSAQAIARLVETYLENRLGADKRYILGEGSSKSLRLNSENRNVLWADYSLLERQSNPIYKSWENYLTNKTAFEKITFDGEYATENQDTTFIMPTHPLVKQACNCFSDEPVRCNLVVKSTELPAGKYPFIVYEWQYKGLKPNNELIVITHEGIESKLMLKLIYDSSDLGDDYIGLTFDDLEQEHFVAWKAEKEKYLTESKQIIGFKLESLTSSQQGQVRAVQNQLSKTTNEQIRIMRQGQLDRLEKSFIDKQVALKNEIDKCDIVAIKLAVGILHVGD